LFVILGVALTGSLLSAGKNATLEVGTHASRFLGVYLPTIGVSWGLFVYVSFVGRAPGVLAQWLLPRWSFFGSAALDVGWALLTFVFIEASEVAAAHWGFPVARVKSILPSSGLERIAWGVFAVSTGFCEEVVYRGYLQTELTRRTSQSGLGMFLAAALFGIAHLDQGVGAAARVSLYGFALGLLARYRSSLWPGILCHVGINLASGLWLR
jgi:membrane protease YdiL (CAAX protease family)